jgi:hypothetical protein
MAGRSLKNTLAYEKDFVEENQFRNHSHKDKLLCAVDGSRCDGPCRKKNTVGGAVKCNETFYPKHKR